ncbi:hypothetical protein MPTK1_4g09110 [Marchantia polymorpha subsp. ruderalis]|uniref:Uncharacterized protein n=2 Tax=Marchantia polymorpha TaxID=3197 RepID=A0AAF6B7Z3_MARPO|nr:hypothetical protein MARPO_0112s0012 [Marchantia polymorpha]BBN08127.1 hypothetical protein Mp_4g09110 [Marchantia polymorpha subsp. ruderalis]|eukprot:PTQ31352.1 hypothetical protein MARPO_0112s0012 [Marchantia polymorpha]
MIGESCSHKRYLGSERSNTRRVFVLHDDGLAPRYSSILLLVLSRTCNSFRPWNRNFNLISLTQVTVIKQSSKPEPIRVVQSEFETFRTSNIQKSQILVFIL